MVLRRHLDRRATGGACELERPPPSPAHAFGVDLEGEVCADARELLDEPYLREWDIEAEDEQLESTIGGGSGGIDEQHK